MNEPPGVLTPEMLTQVMRSLLDAKHEAPTYLVHPREAAWISNPIGPPPTTHAVMVAAEVGVIDAHHPAMTDLMRQLNESGESDA